MKRKLMLVLFVMSSFVASHSYSQVSIGIDTIISASCTDDGSFILRPSNLTPGQPYQWDYTSWPSGYTGTTSSTNNDTFSNLVAGSYTMKLSYIAPGNPFPQNVSRTIVVGQHVIDSRDTSVYVNNSGVAYFDTSFFLTFLAPSCNFDSVWLNIDSALCAPNIQNIVVSARSADGTVYTSNSTLTVLDTTKPFISILSKSFYFNSSGLITFDTSDLIGVAIDSFALSANLTDSLVSTTTWVGNSTAGSGVAFDPSTNLYYSVTTGSTKVIVTYDVNGNQLANNSSGGGFNPIGLWWNSSTSEIEGGSWMSQAIRVWDRDGSNLALGSGAISNTGSAKPNNGSAGAYISSTNEIIYYSSGSIIKYNRSNHTQTGTVTLNNMPSGTFHNSFVGYTGISGAEVVVYNLTNKTVCYFDLTTGNFIGSVSLPSSATANNSYYTAFANNRIWLNSNAAQSKWYGYEMPNIFSNTRGNPSDNCGIASVTLSDTMLTCGNSSVNVTATITDNSGNSYTSSATVTGIDTIKPIVNNLDTVRVYLAGNSVTLDTSLLTISVVENCELDTIRYSLNELNCSHDTIVVFVYADDKSGNVGIDSSVVIVLDTLAPVISCHDSSVFLNNSGVVSYDTSYFVNSITDACLDSVWISSTDTNCTTDTINVTIYARDVAGNIDSCVSRLAILDTILPTITCVDTTVYLDSNGSVTIDTSFVQNGFADNCGVDSVWMNKMTFNCSLNNDSVTLYVRDNSGNIDSCVANVTVLDTIAPEVLTVDSLVVYKTAAGTVAYDSSLLIDSTWDNCSIDSVWNTTFSIVGCSNDTGIVKTFVRDASGNMDSASTVVVVIDTFAVTLVTNDTVLYLTDSGKVSFDTSYFLANFTDPCVDSVWMDSYDTVCGIDTITVTIYARDFDGNIDTATATAAILDTISPYLSTKDITVYVDSFGVAAYDTSMLLGFGQADSLYYPKSKSMAVAYNPLKNVYYALEGGSSSYFISTYKLDGTIISSVTAGWDTRGLWWNKNTNQLEGVAFSSGGLRIVDLDPTTGAALGTGTTIGLTDPKPNSQSMGAYDYINDEILYTNGGTIFRYSRGNHTSLGQVSVSGLPGSVNNNAIIYTGMPGREVGLYDYVNKRVYYVDISSGNYVSSKQLPSSAPSVNSWGVNDANGALWLFDNVSKNWIRYSITSGISSNAVNDNCGLDSVWQDSYDTTCVASGLAVNVTTYAQDLSGNTTSSSSQVTVLDTIVPNVITNDTVVLYSDASGTVTVDTSVLVISTWDNCTIDSVWNTTVTQSCTNDTTIVKTFIRDGSGNMDSASTVVIVLDTLAPVLVCNDTVLYLTDSGKVSFDTSYFLANFTDPCVDSVWMSSYEVSCGVDTLSVTVYARDLSGNVDSCSANALVYDTLRPIILARDLFTYLDSNGQVLISKGDIDSITSDNCGIDTTFISDSIFDCSDVNSPNSLVGAVLNPTFTYASRNVNYNTVTIDGVVTRNANVSPGATFTFGLNWTNTYGGYCPGCIVQYYVGIAGDGVSENCLYSGGASSTFTRNNNFTFTAPTTPGLYAIKLSGGLAFSCGSRNFGAHTSTNMNSVVAIINVGNYSSNVTTAYTVIDVNGNISIDTANIYVSDTIAPNLVAQNKTVYLDSTGNVSFDTTGMIVSTWDNCTVDAISMDITSATCADDSVNVTLTITDVNGNTSNAMATVYVVDTIAPNVILANDTLYLDAMGNASNSLSDINNGSNDNCGISSITLSDSTYTCANVGPNTVTVTVTDNSGNTSTGNATVLVVDSINPIAVCKSVTVYLDSTGNATIVASDLDNGSTDNCGNITLSASQTAFTCSDLGQNSVTLTVTDAYGNSDSCVAMVTVIDIIAPVAQCQPATIYLNASGVATLAASDIDSGSSDNCSVSLSVSQTTFNCSDLGANTVTLTVRDAQGLTSTCTTTVTVLDTLAPMMSCQAVTVNLDASGVATITTADVNNGSTDNCGMTLSLSNTTFDCTNIGANTVTLTGTDASGNTSTCTATVTVVDATAPVVICKPATIYLDNSGNATLTIADVDNGSSDNCGMTLSLSNTAFTCADLGTNTVTLTGVDGNGNTANCTATVTVVDNTAPVASCQPATIYLNASGVATLSASDIDNGSSDNCSVSLSVSQTTFNCSDLGANIVTLTATDAQGLTSTCTTTVTVLDTLAPMMSCQPVTVNLDASGVATITTADVNNGSTDNCSGVTLSLSQTTFGCSELGANTVTLIGTDASGNVDSCTATVTVQDVIDPIALCKPATIYLDTNGEARLVAADIDNGSTDNCSVAVTITDTLFTCADAGANTVTLTATDAAGNTSTCVAIVTVVDTIAPVAHCKADTLYLNASGTASLTAAMINDGSTDNCTFTMSVSESTFTCADLGVSSVTLTVTDAAGNTSTCTSSITVMDTLAPMMSCTPATIYLDALGMATLSASQVDGGSSDNCGIATMSVSRSSFTCADMGTTTVTLTGVDASGNTSTCTTTVTIMDTLAPVVLCKSATIALDATGNATITTLDVDNGSSDNCGITLSLSNSNFNCTNVGVNTVTLTGVDASGNTASCVATVTVIDNMAPTAICQNITLNLDANGQATIVASDVDGGSFDNCAVSSVNVDKTNFDCSNVGRNQVTLTVTDLYGNVSSCVATVTVEDNVAPLVICPADKNRTVRNTTCTYVVEDFAWESSNTDNCTANGTTTEQFPAAGTEVSAVNGRVTITIVTTDASMNADSCTFDVIVTCEQELDIPQFISPNGDGKNDFWDLTELSNYPQNVVKIFNRYGTLVFEQRGYTNEFVGKSNVDDMARKAMGSGLLPDGTYFYVIDLGTNTVDKKVYNGYVQIKK